MNSTVWGVLALRQAAPARARAHRPLAARHGSGRPAAGRGTRGGQADSNDTAAAIEALRALGVRGTPITRGLAYLRRLQNRDGGFELSDGRGSDAQSTAWAIQAFLAAGRAPGAAAFRYLARHAPSRRELPLHGALRDDAGLGHVAGASGARAEAVPASLTSAHNPSMRLFAVALVTLATATAAGASGSSVSLKVTPATVHRGGTVTVHGDAAPCPVGDQVTIISHAFPVTHLFAGVPAVFAKVRAGGFFSTRTTIPGTARSSVTR